MAARFKEQVPILQGHKIFIFNLSDFPHGKLLSSKEGKGGRIDFYESIPGTKVLALNEVTGRAEWADVSNWSSHKDRLVEVVTLRSGRQIITDNDPRAVYGIARGTMRFARYTPEEAFALRVFVPRVDRLDITDHDMMTTNSSDNFRESARRMFGKISLDSNFGYLLGAVAGNGWVSKEVQLCLAHTNKPVANKFRDIVKSLFDGDAPAEYTIDRLGAEGAFGPSSKHTYSNRQLCTTVEELIGNGARSKHLPHFFLSAPAEFRLGLFAGLMDTDGSLSVSGAKDTLQLMSNYSTASLRLAQDVRLLASSLGIKGRITGSKTPAGEPMWVVSFSNIDIKKWNGQQMVHQDKLAKLEMATPDEASTVACRYDVVPVSFGLAEHITKTLGAPRNATLEHKSIYTIFAKAKKSGVTSRMTAKQISNFCEVKDILKHPDGAAWLALVEQSDVSWDQVESFERTNITETGFDLTVPGFETFMNIDGVILSNTLVVHAPISTEANKEAEGLVPSLHLFKPGTNALMVSPTHESVTGLYYLSQTSAGRSKINAIVGSKFSVSQTLDKKGSGALFMRLAKELPPQDFADKVKKLKAIGEDEVFRKGFTLGLDDISQFGKIRDKVVRGIDRLIGKAKTQQELSNLSSRAAGLIDQLIDKRLKGKGNPLYDMVESGARGNKSQLRQILATPLFMQDERGRVVPSVIKKSYAEGLDIGDYWTSLYGARRGMIDRAVQTSLPGSFSKEIMATTIDNVVSAEDCGTKDGISLKVEDPNVLDRYLAGPQAGLTHNTLLDGASANRLKKSGAAVVRVRSPLTCLRARGVCAKCHGLDEHGHDPAVGDNVGAKSGQAIAEPLVQMQMQCSEGHIIDSSGKAWAAIDYYEAQDVEELVVDGVSSKCINNTVRDGGDIVRALNVQRHLPTDDMLFIKTKNGHTLLVQANHPVWHYENKEACEVLAQDLAIGNLLKIDRSFLTGDGPAPMNPYLIGRYLADGSVRYGNGTAKYKDVPVAIIISSPHKEIQAYTVAASDGQGRAYPNDVQIYSLKLADQMRNVVRGREAKRKRLCPGFNLWKKDDLAKLLAGYLDGDSCTYNQHGATSVAKIYTSSYLILQQVEIICHKLGIRFTPCPHTHTKLHTSPPFYAYLTFKDESVRQYSVKLGRIPLVPFSYQREQGDFDAVTYIKKLKSWDLDVYDVQTESRGFTCGMIRNHNTFHTGGVAGTGVDVGGYARINQLLQLPKVVAGAAPLAPVSGKITKIVKGLAGGHDIYVGDKKVHAPTGRVLKVKPGDTVSAGDALSDGSIKPQDLVRYKGMQPAQEYIVNELHKAYSSQGHPISKKTFETIVRSLGNTTQVLNNPKDTDHLPGDIISYTQARAHNADLVVQRTIEECTGGVLAENRGPLKAGHILEARDLKLLKALGHTALPILKDAIVHAPFLKGLKTMPLLRRDWMSALGFQNISKTLVEGASQGRSTELDSYHPVPSLAHGATFGKGKEGKY